MLSKAIHCLRGSCTWNCASEFSMYTVIILEVLIGSIATDYRAADEYNVLRNFVSPTPIHSIMRSLKLRVGCFVIKVTAVGDTIDAKIKIDDSVRGQFKNQNLESALIRLN